MFKKDIQYRKFCLYGFLKNLRFFEPFFVLYLIESGLSFLQIGFLFSIRAITVNIMEIPSGIIADYIGRRRSMILSFTSYILSFLMFFFLPNYYTLIFAMILFAFGDAFRTGTHKAMILDYLKSKGWEEYRTYYYGNTRSWSQRGSAISALIAAALVFYSGNFRSVFLFTLIPYLLELGLMLSYPAFLDGANYSKNRTGKTMSVTDIFKSLTVSLKNRNLRLSFLNSSIPNGFFEAAKDYIQPLLAIFSLSLPLFSSNTDDQRTAVVTGITYSLIFLLTSAASRSSAALSKRFKTEKSYLNLTYAAGMGLLAAAGLLYASGLTLAPIIIFIAYYFVQNLRRPVTVGYLSEQIDSSIMATALSTDSQLKTLWVVILSPLTGFIIDKWSLGAGIAVIGILGFIIFPFVRLRDLTEKSA